MLAGCAPRRPPVDPAEQCRAGLSIVHDERTRGLVLVRAFYMVDEVPIYNRRHATGLQVPIDLFIGRLPDGRHTLRFLLEEEGDGGRIVLRGTLPVDGLPDARNVVVIETRGDAAAILRGQPPPVVAHVTGCTPGAPPPEDRLPADLTIRRE
jgi:hypothetical protein